jgi:hypothetical protein
MDNTLDDDARAFNPIEDQVGPLGQASHAFAVLGPEQAGLRVLGLLSCLALLVVRLTTGNWQAPVIPGGMVLLALVLHGFVRLKTADA